MYAPACAFFPPVQSKIAALRNGGIVVLNSRLIGARYRTGLRILVDKETNMCYLVYMETSFARRNV